MIVVVKQNGIELTETCFLTSVVIYHKNVTLGGSTEHFTIHDGFKVLAMQNTVCKCQCSLDISDAMP